MLCRQLNNKTSPQPSPTLGEGVQSLKKERVTNSCVSTVKNLTSYRPNVLTTSAKPAFTLAEVLITLGIIGVVAAMTMPTLIANYKKMVYINQIKSTVSLLSQGIRLYMADEGMTDLVNSGSLNWDRDINDFNKLWHKYFKVVKDCNQKYLPCFASSYKKLDNSRTIDISPYGNCNVVVTLANGAVVCADAVETNYTDEEGNVITNNRPVGNPRITFEVDINGAAPPNRYGVDYFVAAFDDSGIIYDFLYVQDGFYARPGYDNTTGALGKIMKDNWQMNYPINGNIKESDYDKGPHPRN